MQMVFLDTNILVYAVDPRDVRKHDIASRLVDGAIEKGECHLSTQVLFEFSNVCQKKLGYGAETVLKFLASLKYVPTLDQSAALVVRAVEIKALYGLSLQDAMIVAAAEKTGCAELLTEDLNDGQIYARVKVRNPFK